MKDLKYFVSYPDLASSKTTKISGKPFLTLLIPFVTVCSAGRAKARGRAQRSHQSRQF
jgi:hypothetical protein